jgi:cytochrome c peroxidase
MWLAAGLVLVGWITSVPWHSSHAAADQKVPKTGDVAVYDWELPDARQMLPFADEQPIYFLNKSDDPKAWRQLRSFWNEDTEMARDPTSGLPVKRKVVKIKIPLGLNKNPSVPQENPLTVAKWALGKQLFFDPVLSSDNTVSCATCHDPSKRFASVHPLAVGIHGRRGGAHAPTIYNAAYNALFFWDGRAASLEEQAQGPVQNGLEMHDGPGDAWHEAVERVRRKGDYSERFRKAFGTEPTRDAIAKALACYERTILCGNSIHDRAQEAMKRRIKQQGKAEGIIQARDYKTVLQEAVARRDLHNLQALGIDPERDADQLTEWSRRLQNGRSIFFSKGLCHECHEGDNFTDNDFHNLGIGVVNGQIPTEAQGRFARLPLGHKNAEMIGAFKTPTLRGLVGAGPYMHDGSHPTLEKVTDYYVDGVLANPFLDTLLRDDPPGQATDKVPSEEKNQPATMARKRPAPRAFATGDKVRARKLPLTEQDKKDLVLFMKALQGDPLDPILTDKDKMPSTMKRPLHVTSTIKASRRD